MPTAAGHDGLRIAFAGSAAPDYVLVHATGFCKETWAEVAALLAGGSIVLDQRGHGDSETPAPPFDWWDLGRDVLAVADAVETQQPVGVGHSSGSADSK